MTCSREHRFCVDCGVARTPTNFYPSIHNRCRECHKARVRAWYARTRPDRAAYEQVRSRRSGRRADAITYQRTRRQKDPEKYAARTAVGNAIRDGRLSRMPCEVCGASRAQAHHDDYSKPLDVRWFCFKHHREVGHGQTVTAA